MKTMRLPSPGTNEPTMLSHGVMNYRKAKRKTEIGNWTHSKQREVYFTKKQQYKNALKKAFK